MVALIIICFCLLFGSLLFIFVSLFFADKVAKKPRLIMYSCVVATLLISSIFILATSLPRSIKNIVKEKDIQKIYYVNFENYDINNPTILELDNSRIDDFINYTKNIKYSPYYFFPLIKQIFLDTEFFCIQYSDHYLLLGNSIIEKNSGIYNFDYYLEQNSNKYYIYMKDVINFNMFELKAMFIY